uniref:Prolyl 4-hydroxylase alpha subunit Fe(2+) 2OG dioxygenase domain-containing protein n=1 Tax=Ciona savignyi TaxID=51511 RepID=H2YI77_CIOSA
MAALDVDNFIFSGMWPRLQQLLKFVTNETEWYPYDVALNYVRTADHTRIHPDAEKHQEEFTLLLYLSEGLTPSNFGETNWVVMKKDDGILSYIGPGGEVYETIAAVAPKFGRMVIFKNNIEHSAHPPSTSYFGGRYSFAVKVGRTKRLAFIKRVYERMEGVMMDENMKTFNQQLMVGMHDNPNKSKVTTDQLVKFFKKVAKMAKNQRTEEADRVFQHALQSF